MSKKTVHIMEYYLAIRIVIKNKRIVIEMLTHAMTRMNIKPLY